MKTAPAPIALIARIDINAHVQSVSTQVHFLTSRRPVADDLVHKIRGSWMKRVVPIDPGTDRRPLAAEVDATAKDLLALGAADPVMKPYAMRVLSALDSLGTALLKSDEEYARENLPIDRNQIVLDKIRALLAEA